MRASPLQFFINISVPDGGADKVAAILRDLVAVTEEKDAGTLSYHFAFNEDRTRVFGIEIHETPEALESHMKTTGDLAYRLFSIAAVESITAIGPCPPEIKEALAPFNPTFHEESIAGFTRG